MPEISTELIKTILDFYTKVRSEDEVWISFIKKDGTKRVMNCTLNFNKIPAQYKPKDVNLEKILKLIQVHRIMHVFDLEKNDWRSVPFDSVEYLETPIKNSTQRMRFRIAK